LRTKYTQVSPTLRSNISSSNNLFATMMASKKQPNSNAANSKGKSLAITSTAEDFASYASRRATVNNCALPSLRWTTPPNVHRHEGAAGSGEQEWEAVKLTNNQLVQMVTLQRAQERMWQEIRPNVEDVQNHSSRMRSAPCSCPRHNSGKRRHIYPSRSFSPEASQINIVSHR